MESFRLLKTPTHPPFETLAESLRFGLLFGCLAGLLGHAALLAGGSEQLLLRTGLLYNFLQISPLSQLERPGLP